MKKWPFEALAWLSALLYLVCIDPLQSGFSICPLHLLGFSWCPGCGLGHSIAWLMEGELQKSIDTHWLGIPALLAILHRTAVLLRPDLFRYFHLFQFNKKIRTSTPS